MSLEETAICIVDDTGRIVRDALAASEPEALIVFFTACGMKMEGFGLEACSLTAWLRRSMTVQSVGPLTALTFRATNDKSDLVWKSRDVGAHLGLTPRRYRSGETDVQGRISHCDDELARTALYDAAHSLLTRSTKWSAWRAWGMNIARRRGMARARVAVARKLSVILHRIWVDSSEFRWGKQAEAAA